MRALLSVLLLLPCACATTVYRIEADEAQRALLAIADKNEVLVEAHSEGRRTGLLLYPDDLVQVDFVGSGESEWHRLRDLPSDGGVESLRLQHRNPGPALIISGAITFAAGFAIAAAVASATQDSEILIPIYGPARPGIRAFEYSCSRCDEGSRIENVGCGFVHFFAFVGGVFMFATAAMEATGLGLGVAGAALYRPSRERDLPAPSVSVGLVPGPAFMPVLSARF
ncbi:MAG: hypothetical protein JXR96_21900 [Deltaproteobacteria bacterium]|nr:hypothetical protein [Deltaproteobacteria bacterium]